MFSCEFNIFSTKSIILRFNCCKCKEPIEEILENIPTPNLMAEKDTHSATLELDTTYIECPNCHKEYSINLSASICGGELYSDDLDESTEVEIEDCENEYFEDYSEIVESNSKYFDTFCNQMESNKKLFENDILKPELIETLNKLLFVNLITCLETYLSDAIINSIFNNEQYLKRFVENFKDYHKLSFNLNDIYKEMDKLQKRVKDDLFELMYHNLPKISNIYKIIFDIDIPDNMGEIMQRIKIRHDLVHRNGKDKNNKEINISKPQLVETYDLIYNFIKEIDNKLNERIT